MANHPLWQLTLVRFREFLREPEALFWVFGFPLLLAAGLGLAFRNAPAEEVSIGFVGLSPDAFEQAPLLTDVSELKRRYPEVAKIAERYPVALMPGSEIAPVKAPGPDLAP